MRLIFVHPIPVPTSHERIDYFCAPEWRIEFEPDGVRLTHEETGVSFVHRGTGYSFSETPAPAPVALMSVREVEPPPKAKTRARR